MNKSIKVLAWAVGIVLTLAVVAIAAFALLFDPNAFRDDITRLVEKQTGRQLTIEGDLSMTFFPWLGFEAGRTTLSNAAGFSEPVMLSFDSAGASVKLLPLLSRRVELSQVTLDGADLKLQIRQDGTSNWDDLLALQNTDGADPDADSSFASDGIGGIRLSNTRVSYDDKQAGTSYAVSNLSLETGALKPGASFDLSASGDIVSETDEIAGPAEIEGEVDISKDGEVRITDLRLKLSASGNGLPGKEVNLDLQAPLLETADKLTRVTLQTPVLEMNGTGNGDPWSTMKARVGGQSISVTIESPRVMKMDKPVMDIDGTSPGDSWRSVKGQVSGQSLSLTLDTPMVVNVDKPVMDLTGTGPGDPWATMKTQGNGQTLSMNLEIPTALKIDKPVLDLDATGTGDSWKAMKGKVNGTSLSLNNADRFELNAMQVNGDVSSPDLPDGKVTVAMTGAQMQGSMDNESLAIDIMRAQLLDLTITSKKLKASKFIEAPVIDAPIEIAKFSPAKLIQRLGLDPIITADPTALSSATVSGNAHYDEASMGLKNMKALVDQTAVTGSVQVMETGEIRFQIDADTINLDRYRSPAETPQEAGQAATVADIDIPTDDLRALALDGTLKVGTMEMVGLKSSAVEIGIRAKNGDIRIKPARASLYSGTYEGDIHLDATGKLPVLSLNEKLDGVQFGPLSADLFNSNRLTGRLSGRMTVVGTGTTSNQITASSNGDMVFSFADGAYEGTDMPYQVRRARALIKGEAAPTTPDSKRTQFGQLSGTAQINNGILTSKDINVVMPFMKVRGSGTMVLVSQEIDFDFTGDVYDRPELTASDNDLVGFPVPIRMTGTASEPKVGVNMGGLLAALAKRKLLGKIGLGARPAEPSADADADADAAAQPTPEELAKQKEDELKNKLKDKLKGLLGGGGDGG